MNHAAVRADERYGFPLTPADERQIVLDIVDGIDGTRQAALLQCRYPDGQEVWLVSVRGIAMRALWCPRLACVKTILPWRRRA